MSSFGELYGSVSSFQFVLLLLVSTDRGASALPQLALATNSSSYYSDAVKFYNQYNLNPTDTVFNWDSVTPALPVLFVQIALARPSVASNVTGWQTIAEKAFDGIIAGSGRAKQTKGGLLWVGVSP